MFISHGVAGAPRLTTHRAVAPDGSVVPCPAPAGNAAAAAGTLLTGPASRGHAPGTDSSIVARADAKPHATAGAFTAHGRGPQAASVRHQRGSESTTIGVAFCVAAADSASPPIIRMGIFFSMPTLT